MPTPNYSICGLPFYLSGETPDWHALAHRTGGDIQAAGVHLLLDHMAEHVDTPGQTLHVRPPSAAAVILSYDHLIIATGAEPIVPPLPGVDLPGVHVLHTMEHSFAIDEALTAGARTAVVVGAGYIGVEMADALTRRGLDVTLVEMADCPYDRGRRAGRGGGRRAVTSRCRGGYRHHGGGDQQRR